MDEPLKLTSVEKGTLKIGVTVAYARMYGLDYGAAADYFYRKGAYDYIDAHSGLLVTKMYPFVAELVAEEYGVPQSRQSRIKGSRAARAATRRPLRARCRSPARSIRR